MYEAAKLRKPIRAALGYMASQCAAQNSIMPPPSWGNDSVGLRRSWKERASELNVGNSGAIGISGLTSLFPVYQEEVILSIRL